LALERAQWRVSGPNGAAKLLGVKPTTLADRMKKFKIDKPRTTAGA
jgi:transcriptional regulator with GAF, ATPase, and Fis domain